MSRGARPICHIDGRLPCRRTPDHAALPPSLSSSPPPQNTEKTPHTDVQNDCSWSSLKLAVLHLMSSIWWESADNVYSSTTGSPLDQKIIIFLIYRRYNTQLILGISKFIYTCRSLCNYPSAQLRVTYHRT